MADLETMRILSQGVLTWNTWRRDHPELQPDLSGARLHGALLPGADFSLADLRGAELGRAELDEADLGEADLGGAVLTKARLERANLAGAHAENANLAGAGLPQACLFGAHLYAADLCWSDFRGADLRSASLVRSLLRNADLSGARLDRADLTGAIACHTHFADLDLSAARGLGQIEHAGPSYLDVHALYRSRGLIPEVFLRGCGLPDDLIAFATSPAMANAKQYTCALSFSPKDRSFADRLYADLQARGMRAYFQGGEAGGLRSGMDAGKSNVSAYDRLVVICSRYSLQSRQVLAEIENALAREASDGGRVLFLAKIDEYVTEGWEHELRAEVVGRPAADFTVWRRRAAYLAALDQLLAALVS